MKFKASMMGCLGIGRDLTELIVLLVVVSVIDILYDVINPSCRISKGGLISITTSVCCMLKILTLCTAPVGAEDEHKYIKLPSYRNRK